MAHKVQKAGYLLFLLPARALSEGQNPNNSESLWGAIAAMIGIIAFYCILFAIGCRAIERDRKLWETHKTKVTRAQGKIRLTTTLEDLRIPRENKKYAFQVQYRGIKGWHSARVKPGTSDMEIIIAHLDKSVRVIADAHIKETRILAINSEAVTEYQRISITKALLGGMIAGDTGFILGALSGTGKKTLPKSPDEYTFLVVYDDRPSEVEKVYERTYRFRFLSRKLK